MKDNPNASPLLPKVQQALGRALIRLQHLEKNLKCLVVGRFVSAEPAEPTSGFNKRKEEVMASPLGWLKEELLGKYVRPEGAEQDDSEIDRAERKGHFAIRFQLSIPPADHARLEEHLNIVHQRRNQLVQHFLDRFNLNNEEGCRSALDFLEETHRLLDVHQREILAFVTWTAPAHEAMAKAMQSPEFQTALLSPATSSPATPNAGKHRRSPKKS